jgi:hypothetical protein
MIGSLDLAVALLLAGAGAAKVGAPDQAVAMLIRAWPRLRPMPSLRAAVRVGGGVEVLVGLAVVADGGRVAAALLAACYLGFLGIAVRLTRLGDRLSCGCFGRTDSPVGLPHVVFDLAGLGVALAGVVRPAGRFGGLFDHDAVIAIGGSAQAALLAYLGFLSITALPALLAGRREVSS